MPIFSNRFRFLRRINDEALMCFAVSVGAFLAAGCGAIVNHFLTGWMAVGGMTGVGLLYFAMGWFSLRGSSPRPNETADPRPATWRMASRHADLQVNHVAHGIPSPAEVARMQAAQRRNGVSPHSADDQVLVP